MSARRSRALFIVTTIYLVLAVVWAIGMRAAEFWWPSTLLLYAPQHIWLLVPLFILLLALLRRDRTVLIVECVTIIIIIFGVIGFRLPICRTGAKPGIPLRVMTYNIQHGTRGFENAASTIRKLSPDVVCLQEANPGPWNSDLPKRMDALLRGWHIVRFRAFATLSRYPIVSQRIHRMQPETGRIVLETVLNVEGRRLVVLNTHLSTAMKGSLSHRDVTLQEYLADAVSTRSFQVDVLRKVVGEAKGAVVVMGDFNNPPRGVLYYRMLRPLNDAFNAGGFGFGHTYSARQPMLRIDYVFVNDRIGVRRCFVPKVKTSDHRPVVADLIILGSDAER